MTEYSFPTEGAYVGPPGLNWKGPWSALADYDTPDVVRYGGSLWFARRPSRGAAPAEGANWTLFLEPPIGSGGGSGGGSAGGLSLNVRDEGENLVLRGAMNFVGEGVEVTPGDDEYTVTIPGAEDEPTGYVRVRCATTVPLTTVFEPGYVWSPYVPSTDGSTPGNPAPVFTDGVQVKPGDAVFVKNQGDAPVRSRRQNGVYVVTASGPWTRHPLASTAAHLEAGLQVYVQEGALNKNSEWRQTHVPLDPATGERVPFQVGTSPQDYTKTYPEAAAAPPDGSPGHADVIPLTVGPFAVAGGAAPTVTLDEPNTWVLMPVPIIVVPVLNEPPAGNRWRVSATVSVGLSASLPEAARVDLAMTYGTGTPPSVPGSAPTLHTVSTSILNKLVFGVFDILDPEVAGQVRMWIKSPDASAAAPQTFALHRRSGYTQAQVIKDVAAPTVPPPDTDPPPPPPPPPPDPTDTTPPGTQVTSGPADGDTVARASVSFSFTATEPNCTFEVSMDGSPWARAVSPKDYTGLSESSHTFRVRATDPSGNTDPVPSERTFRVDVTATPPPDPGGGGTFPGIRWYPIMGVYAGADRGWVEEDHIIDEQFRKYVGAHQNDYLNLGGTRRYWFGGGRKITWKDAMADDSRAPTSRAQGQDPDWGNYMWNVAGKDYITRQINASDAVAQGKAKLALFVAVSATSVKYPVPRFIMNHPNNLHWKDGDGKDHVRFDKQEGVNYAADFMIALCRKYGRDPRVASITIGEYYTNEDAPGGHPPGFDYDQFKRNQKGFWQQIVDGCPKDSRGNRVNIVQSQPITSGGFITASDIIQVGIGVSGSGAKIFESGPVEELRPRVYGKVPNQHQVNVGPLGDQITFDGTLNPWGHPRGARMGVKYEHLAWYYGSKGPNPLDSLLMRDDNDYVDQWEEAYNQFGPNGSRVANWGQIPHYPPNQ